jgi:hypothetical protein
MKVLFLIVLFAGFLLADKADLQEDEYLLSDNSGSLQTKNTPSRNPNVVVATLLSAVIPGAGQIYCGKVRGLIYISADLVFGANLVRNKALKYDSIRHYKDFAYEHAQYRYTDDDKYYEYLAMFRSSDEYNEASRQEAWFYYNYPDMGWDAATRDAYYDYWKAGDQDYWYWDNEGNMKEFSNLMDKTNKYSQRANLFLGLMVFNRLVSAVDALFTARMLHKRAKLSSLIPTPRVDPFNTRLELGWRF